MFKDWLIDSLKVFILAIFIEAIEFAEFVAIKVINSLETVTVPSVLTFEVVLQQATESFNVEVQIHELFTFNNINM